MNFLIIAGASQSGTTAAYDMISTVNGISCSKKKELNFLCEEYKEKKILHKYIKKFSQHGKWYFEASPKYLRYPEIVIENIKKLTAEGANIKLVFILRDPNKRLIAIYNKISNLSVELGNLSFDEFKKMCFDGFQPEKLKSEFIEEIRSRADVGNYHNYLAQYIENFSKQDLMVFDFNEFIEFPQKFNQNIENLMNNEVKITNSLIKKNSNLRVKNILIHKIASYIYNKVEIIIGSNSKMKNYLSRVYAYLNKQNVKRIAIEPESLNDYYLDFSKQKEIFGNYLRRLNR